MSEEYSYDQDGRRTAYADFAGQVPTYEYNTEDRLARLVFPDGSERAISYTTEGRIREVTEEGMVTTYDYDTVGRLVPRRLD